MRRPSSSSSISIALALVVLATLQIGLTRDANAADRAGWTFGIGTGLERANAEGEMGFTSFRGSENADLDLSPSDFDDLMQSAFGFKAFAANRDWRFEVHYATLTLQDKSVLELSGGALPPLTTRFEQDITVTGATVTRNLWSSGRHVWGLVGGIRQTEHDYDIRIQLDDARATRNLDADWTDLIVGVAHTMPLSESITWTSTAHVGFGDSDEYWAINTALNAQFHEHWIAGLFIHFDRFDVESGGRGKRNWYRYQADEWGPGISIAFIF